jgi:hypothetical protein
VALGDALPILRIWALRIVLLSPPILLLFAALPRLISGAALEAAFPVPAYMEVGRGLPIKTYSATERILAGADEADGDAQIARSHAAYLSGESGPKIIAMVENGLSREPSSAAGWTLFAVLSTPIDRTRAATALSVALELAPREYYLAAWQARTAAPLWADLSADARENAARQMRLLWSDHTLRHQIRSVLAVPGGSALVTYAMRDNPDELRALNRMVARQRLRLPDTD